MAFAMDPAIAALLNLVVSDDPGVDRRHPLPPDRTGISLTAIAITVVAAACARQVTHRCRSALSRLL